MAVGVALGGHALTSVAQVLKDLSPQLGSRRRQYLGRLGSCCQQRHVSVHRSQLIVEEGTHEEGLTLGLVFLRFIKFNGVKSLQEGVGTVDTLVALLPEVACHVGVIVQDEVHCLHQLIVGTAASELVVTGEECVVMPCLLRIGIHGVQVLIDTGERLGGIFSVDREVRSILLGQTHRVQVARSKCSSEKHCA